MNMSKETFKRNCPECQVEIEYKNRCSVRLANKRSSRCKSCAVSGANNPMYGMTGSLNPFFGKNHTAESKAKQRAKMRGRKLSKEHKAKVVAAGMKNLIQGSMYEYWIKKHGQKEADRRLENIKAKHSKNNSGEGNPMYGKPSPQGSGNGWSGWYNGWFFRSLRELKYVISLEEQGISWKPAETQEYKVEYVGPQGLKRNYFPDFVVNNQTVVECKPKRLWATPSVKAKTLAAQSHFEQMGMEYKLVDPGKFDENKFKKLWKDGKVKLTDTYQEKALKKYYGK